MKSSLEVKETGEYRQKSIALLLSKDQDTKPVVLHFDGPDLWDLWDSGTLEMHFEGLEPGIWIWSGYVDIIEHNTPNGRDFDSELSGEFRELTDEEWNIWNGNAQDPPWHVVEMDEYDPDNTRPKKMFENGPDWSWNLIEGDSWGCIISGIEAYVTSAHLGGYKWEWRFGEEISEGHYLSVHDAVHSLKERIIKHYKELGRIING